MKVGFMQGRLSPVLGGRIQSFPWDTWQDEFSIAAELGFTCLEWTLDQDRFYENPIMTLEGQATIRKNCEQWNFEIPSLTGDCFMQVPFWKTEGSLRNELVNNFTALIRACHSVGIRLIIVPLVDNGTLETKLQEDLLLSILEEQYGLLAESGVKIAFESDYEPQKLSRFIDRFEGEYVGINYDMGNSAALGYDCRVEFAAYKDRILNVHVKDRVLGGTTVPLGKGNVHFEQVFEQLLAMNYDGCCILQTARAEDEQHAKVLSEYRTMTLRLLGLSEG